MRTAFPVSSLSSRNRRFQEAKRSLLSKTQMPWLTFSSVARNSSWLNRMACDASSSTVMTSVRDNILRCNDPASTTRAEAAPIAPAKRRSVNRTLPRLARPRSAASRPAAEIPGWPRYRRNAS